VRGHRPAHEPRQGGRRCQRHSRRDRPSDSAELERAPTNPLRSCTTTQRTTSAASTSCMAPAYQPGVVLAGKPHRAEQTGKMRRVRVPRLATHGVWIYQPSPRSILHVAKCNGPE
jgi:hypothetical protein